MTEFASMFAGVGFDVLASMHGETVPFTPKGGTARDIVVIIDYQAAAAIPGAVQGFAPFVDAFIKYHATEGAVAIVKGGDALTFAPRVGLAAQAYKISDILLQGDGFWKVRISVNG